MSIIYRFKSNLLSKMNFSSQEYLLIHCARTSWNIYRKGWGLEGVEGMLWESRACLEQHSKEWIKALRIHAVCIVSDGKIIIIIKKKNMNTAGENTLI